VKHYLQVTEDHFKQAAKKSDAKCGALATTSRSGDDDLAQLINAWPSLPTTIRRGIMAMVEEMRKE